MGGDCFLERAKTCDRVGVPLWASVYYQLCGTVAGILSGKLAALKDSERHERNGCPGTVKFSTILEPKVVQIRSSPRH